MTMATNLGGVDIKTLRRRPKNEGSVLDEGAGRRKRGPPSPLYLFLEMSDPAQNIIRDIFPARLGNQKM